MTKKLLMPTGTESFEKLRNNGYYYVDKTGLIEKLFDSPAEVNLFTRPRRFGKSLNISMLQSFFEIGRDPGLFDGLKITKNKGICEKHQNKYPVISLLLNYVSGENFEEARSALCTVIVEEYERQRLMLNDEPKMKREWEQADKLFDEIRSRNGEPELLKNSLKTLIHLLSLEYGKQSVLLIDEYDVPLQKAYIGGYYDKMVELMSNFLGRAMKTNTDIAFAVLTGCMRISNESIFTGMNNAYVYSITDPTFDEYFGFTESEVKQILKDSGYSEAYADTKEWYDGYRFGDKDIYCPFDVVNHCKNLMANGNSAPQVYWINSSSNDIIRSFLKNATQEMREDFRKLINSGSIGKAIDEHITYRDMDKQPENLWSVMYMTGYLTLNRNCPKQEDGLFNLVIPNKEVKQIFETSFAIWLEQDVYARNRSQLINRLWECDTAAFSAQLQELLYDTVSFYDCNEGYYHGLLTGLMKNSGYEVKSNRENGKGRSDITLEDSAHRRAAVIEIKISKEDSQLKESSLTAIKQIKEKEYAQPFIIKNYNTVICGAAFKGKDCSVAMEKLPR